MTTTAPPVTDTDLHQILRPMAPEALADLISAQREWESNERTRSTITVFTFVMAGMALVASIVAWGYASHADTHRAPAAAVAAPSPYSSTQITASLTEYNVALPATILTAGVKTVRIVNAGKTVHELLVFHPSAAIDPNHLPLRPDGNVDEDAPGINKVSDGENINAGEVQTREIDLSQPGAYVFVCNLPAHSRLGMRTTVAVVANNTRTGG